MTPELIYLIKINTALIIFYIFYRVLFYKDTFFALRRLLLVSFLISAFIYPFLNLQDWLSQHKPIAGVITGYTVFLPEITIEANTGTGLPWQEWIFFTIKILYIAGIAILLSRFILQLGSVLWLKISSQKACIEETNIYIPEKECQPFSFFHWIFIQPGNYTSYELKEILTHEKAHARQWHSIDVLLCELTCMLCWFNPFVWLLKREVRYNLEYLADHTVLKSGCDSKSYQYHLLGLAYTQPEKNMYNNFNINLKKRITMMNQKRTHVLIRAKYLLAIPLVIVLLLINSTETIAGISNSFSPEKNQDKNSLPIRLLEEIIIVGFNKKSNEPGENAGNFTKSDEELNLIKLAESSEIDQPPAFPGGDEELLKFISKAVRYPVIAHENGIQGRVVVSFTINEDGSVSDPEIIQGPDPSLEKEALRVVESMPAFEPGIHEGKAIKVKYTLPFTFRLQASNSSFSEPKNPRDLINWDNIARR